MFTKDNLLDLVKNEGSDAVATAVSKVPDEELRNALMLLVMLYQNTVKLEKEVWKQEHTRCTALETELQEAQERITALEKSN